MTGRPPEGTVHRLMLIGTLSPETWRFLKYAAIGIFNGVVDFAVLGILVWAFDPERELSVVAVNTTAFFAASFNSFVLHSRLTFQRRLPLFSRWFALFFVVNLGNLVLSNISLLTFRWLLQSTTPLEGQLAILVAKPLTALVLVSYGYFAFRRLFVGPDSPMVASEEVPGRSRVAAR
ncbi:MAG: hypothetical protein GEU28_02780 [Dehalococcoidia bacterium]|nr:hypothetical protein [Dehalococcoidia bacterium]